MPLSFRQSWLPVPPTSRMTRFRKTSIPAARSSATSPPSSQLMPFADCPSTTRSWSTTHRARESWIACDPPRIRAATPGRTRRSRSGRPVRRAPGWRCCRPRTVGRRRAGRAADRARHTHEPVSRRNTTRRFDPMLSTRCIGAAALSLCAGLAVTTANAEIFQRISGDQSASTPSRSTRTEDGGYVTTGFRDDGDARRRRGRPHHQALLRRLDRVAAPLARPRAATSATRSSRPPTAGTSSPPSPPARATRCWASCSSASTPRACSSGTATTPARS
jgi:hypothetical protein